jgi:hypothetical protein
MHTLIQRKFTPICFATLLCSTAAFADDDSLIIMIPGLIGNICNKPAEIIPSTISLPLNDTGNTWGGNYPSGENTTCTSNITGPQDCNFGRDANKNNNCDGYAGFSFTKIDSKGKILPANAATWSCVRDNVTGLIWEVKTNDSSIHDKDNTYRWGGKTARGSGYGTYYNDWNSLVDGSNSKRLCGFSDWRVPNRTELQSLVIHDGGLYRSIDTAFFPNTKSEDYWSASPIANTSTVSWYVNFNDGITSADYRSKRFYVRLVRSSLH